MSHVRITRGDAPGGMFGDGAKRMAQYGKVEAVGDDGTTVDLSNCVTLTTIELRPGELERAVVTFVAFEVFD